MANRSQVLSCSVSTRTHGAVHMPDMIDHRFICLAKPETLPRVVIRKNPSAWTALASSLALDYDSTGRVESQMSSKAAYFIEFEPSMPREVGSHHFGTTRFSYGIFRAPDLPNMAMTHRIMTCYCMVEPRLPADKHAQWKKRQKKVLGLALNIYE